MLQGFQNPNFPTRDQTSGPGTETAESYPLDYQRIPAILIFVSFKMDPNSILSKNPLYSDCAVFPFFKRCQRPFQGMSLLLAVVICCSVSLFMPGRLWEGQGRAVPIFHSSHQTRHVLELSGGQQTHWQNRL